MAEAIPVKAGDKGFVRFSTTDTIPASALPARVIISPAQITADQDDYNPSGFGGADVVRLDFDAAGYTITGFNAESAGEEKVIVNVSVYYAIIAAEHPDSTAANRISGAEHFVLAPNGTVRIVYDDTTDRWRVVSNSTVPAGLGMSAFGQWFSQMPGSTNQSDHPFLGLGTSGTGASNANNPSTTTLPASWSLTTGTTATGTSTIYLIKNNVTFAAFGGAHLCAFGTVWLPTLSTSGQRYTAVVGFSNTASSSSLVSNNQLGVRYSDDVNSGKWQLYSRDNGGTESTVDSGVTAAANTAYRIVMYFNSARTEAIFYINGAYVGRITANLPSAVVCGVRISAVKSVGTTAADLRVSNIGAWTIY